MAFLLSVLLKIVFLVRWSIMSQSGKDAKSIIDKIVVIRRIIVSLFFICFLAFIISIACEIKNATSVYEFLGGPSLPNFVSSKSISEIVKIIGLSSVLIGIICANMDKEILGLSYLEIFQNTFKEYRIYSCVHIIFVLLCCGLSVTGFTESSWITLAVVFLGTCYQVLVVSYSIFNIRAIEKLAYNVWETRANGNVRKSKDDEDRITYMKRYAMCLAKNIPEKGNKYYDGYLYNFTTMLVGFAKKNKENNVKSMSEIWRLLKQNSVIADNENLVEDVMLLLIKRVNDIQISENEEVDKDDMLCKMISGYIVSEFNELQETTPRGELLELSSCFNRIRVIQYNMQTCLEQKYQQIVEIMFDFIRTNMYILLWVYFQCEKVVLTQDLLMIIPEKKNEKYTNEILEILIKPFVDKKEVYDTYVHLAKGQLNCRVVVE